MRKRIIGAIAILGTLLAGGVNLALADTLPVDKPLYTTSSYYMHTADIDTLGSMGCAAGGQPAANADPRSDFIILAFGAPKSNNGTLGTIIYETDSKSSPGFASTADIEQGAEAFITGYLNCADQNSHLGLVLGTSNWGTDVTAEHGVAWASMVQRVADWNADNLFANRVSVYGGSDIEPDWGSAKASRAWVDGYMSAGPPTFYDFGDAGGCPTTDKASSKCNNGWTVDDIWYVAWGSGGRQPIPQIYNSAQAKQWYQLKLYSLTKTDAGLQPMVIAGVLTEDGACQQSGGCGPGFNFTAKQGYQGLADLLKLRPEVAQDLPYSTDIRKAWVP